MQSTKHIIYVDASYKKYLERGYIAWFNETTRETFHDTQDCKDSFRCEYIVIIHALENARQIKEGDQVEIRSDNETVVKQLNRKYAINDEDIRQHALKIWSLNEKYNRKAEFVWIRRRDNKAGKILGS